MLSCYSHPLLDLLLVLFSVEIRFSPTNNVYPANEKESNVEVIDIVILLIFSNTVKGDIPPNISIIDRHVAMPRGKTMSLMYLICPTPFSNPFSPNNFRLSIIYLKIERILSRTAIIFLFIVVLIISILGYSVVLYILFSFPSFTTTSA